jgi:hypothetical protein
MLIQLKLRVPTVPPRTRITELPVEMVKRVSTIWSEYGRRAFAAVQRERDAAATVWTNFN